MKQANWLFIGFFIVFSWSNAYSQDCDAILRHGIRNIQVSKSTEASIATKYFNHCRKDFSQASDAVLASIEVEVFGFAGGSGSFTRRQREERLTEWCQQNSETAQLFRNAYQESQTIYGDAVSAWDRCNKIKNSEVQIEPQISPDAKTVDIRLRYTGSGGNGVQLVGVERENFTCKVQVPTPRGIREFDPNTPTLIDRQSINVHCNRALPQSLQRDGTTYSFLQRGTISILTAGQSLQLFFEAEWEPGLPIREAERIKSRLSMLEKHIVPIGAVIPFFLTPQEAAQLQPIWLPADGREVTDTASPLNGRKLPDLRGRFPLGAPPNEDVIPKNDTNESGSNRIEARVRISNGNTGLTTTQDLRGRQTENREPLFVIDTPFDELKSSNHYHGIEGDFTLSAPLPLPPFRRLVYMVRVRD